MERALTDICEELHNWFTPNREDRHAGTFTISRGTLVLPDDLTLLDGQYFRISNSALNDGVYRYPAFDLNDEVFEGYIWAMRVPLIVLDIAAEVEAYQTQSSADGSPPYVSESFGGYSYTKATGSDGAPLTWREVFASRLNRWRKLP